MTTDMLKRLIGSIKETRAELAFQVERLDKIEDVDGRSEEEREHLKDLADGYSEAGRYLLILLNYQEGRLERQEGGEA